MDSKISTSFIPKDSLSTTGLRPRREPLGIIVIISILVLAAALVYFAGIYAYRYIVDQELNSPCADIGGGNKKCGLKESLKIQTQDLQLTKLEDFKRLDAKLNDGATVLSLHVSLKPFFDFLGQLTGQNIQYTKFEFSKTNSFTIEGLAKSYDDIAFQQKVFAGEQAQKYIKSFAFSDFDLDAKGNVKFKLLLTVDPTLLSFASE